MNQKTTQKIYELINGERTISDISNITQISSSTVHYHIMKLIEKGKVVKIGGKYAYSEQKEKADLIKENAELKAYIAELEKKLNMIQHIASYKAHR